MEFRQLVGWVFLGFGSFYALVSIPLAMRWVPMNKFGYGFPFATAFTSDKNWYAINRFGGLISIALGLALAAIGAVVLFGPRFSELLLFPAFVIPPASIAASYFVVYRYGQRVQQ